MTAILITSAANSDAELVAEYGPLPPAFLPVGHRRLYQSQAETLRRGNDGDLYLTLPESFRVPGADSAWLAEAGIETVPVPDGLRLGESILYALNVIGSKHHPVKILHGDTLIYDLPLQVEDVVAIGEAPEFYEWAAIQKNDSNFSSILTGEFPEVVESGLVLAGYFSFSDEISLRRALARSGGDFIAAINEYRASVGLQLEQVHDWLDFGHLQTYYRSRCRVRTQRVFNELEISFRTVEKRSHDKAKLRAEAYWFDNIPRPLRRYTPAFLGAGEQGDLATYSTEYLPIPSLHELFVFGNLSRTVWSRILEACLRFIADCLALAPDAPRASVKPPLMQQLTLDKTLERLQVFETAFALEPGLEWKYEGRAMPALRRIAELSAELIDTADSRFEGVMHGDLCFTNIFYDFRTQQIRVIDPRGGVDIERPSILGDLRYDMAKLHHSLVGGYDLILAGRMTTEGFDERDASIRFPADSAIAVVPELLGDFDVNGLRLDDAQICAICIHLFLSMLPLHADRPDRQKAFVANALRLYSMLEEMQ